MNDALKSHMYFVALCCPEELDTKMRQYKHWMRDRFGCVAALKSPAHITLIPPFWLEEEQQSVLMDTLDNFVSNVKNLSVQLNGFSHFNHRVLFAQVTENALLATLQQRAENHFHAAMAGKIKKATRPFHPHITIASRDMKPSAFEEAWKYFGTKVFSESFRADAISLLKLREGKWQVMAEKEW